MVVIREHIIEVKDNFKVMKPFYRNGEKIVPLLGAYAVIELKTDGKWEIFEREFWFNNKKKER